MGELTNKDLAIALKEISYDCANHYDGFGGNDVRLMDIAAERLAAVDQEPDELSIVNSLLPDGWMLEYNKKPVPDRSHDWDFTHLDYDYCSETGSNGLSGTAGSPTDALQQIIRIESERKFSAEKEEIRRYCFSFMDFHFDYSGSNAFDDWWDQQGEKGLIMRGG